VLPRRADPALAVALVAVTLFGAAILAARFPYGRAIALGLSGFGTVVGLGCVLAGAGRARLVGSSGVLLNLAVVGVVALRPDWVGLTPWRELAQNNGPTTVQAVSHGTRIAAGADWVDASQASWVLQDVRVSVHSAVISPVELTGPGGVKRKTKEPYLQLLLRVTNEGLARRIEFTGWAAGGTDGLRLTNTTGRAFKIRTFDPGWEVRPGPRPAGVFPGKTAEVLFTFDAPVERGEAFRLELPGTAVGVEEPVRLYIPGAFVILRRPS
jgi:hypothetical protein